MKVGEKVIIERVRHYGHKSGGWLNTFTKLPGRVTAKRGRGHLKVEWMPGDSPEAMEEAWFPIRVGGRYSCTIWSKSIGDDLYIVMPRWYAVLRDVSRQKNGAVSP